MIPNMFTLYFVQSFTTVSFVMLFWGKRGLKTFIPPALCVFITTSVINSFIPSATPAKSIVVFLAIFISTLYFFKIQWQKALFTTLLITVISFFAELIGASVLYLGRTWLSAVFANNGDIYSISPDQFTVISAILHAIICLLFCIILIFRSNIGIKSKIVLLLSSIQVFILQYVGLIGLYQTQTDWFLNSQFISYFFSFLLSGGFYFFCIVGIQFVSYQREKQLEYEYISMHYEQVQTFYNMSAEMQEENKKFRHDVKNQILCLHELISINPDDAKKMLVELNQSIESKGVLFNTGNSTLDVVLSLKYMQAKNSKISMDISVNSSSEIPLSDADCCNLFSNILDNALEATEKMPTSRQEIQLKLAKNEHYFVIRCENPFEGEITPSDGGFLSKKRKFKSTGYGLQIVNDIVKRNRGEINISTENQTFVMTILLPLNAN